MELGAQLYTVRSYTQTEQDLRHTLERVAAIGYRTVQLSGIGGVPPHKVRELCDEFSLRIALTHVSPERILGDTDALIEEHDLYGCSYIGIGSMPEKYRTEEWFHRFVEDYREPARKIAAAGKLLMYHNHDFEWEKIGGTRIIELLASAFRPDEMGFTLDTYWVQAAGADVIQWIEYLHDRIPCVHLKDMTVSRGRQLMAPVLEGNMNFESILHALEKAATTKYLLVEQDICQESPFTCLEKSYNNLSKYGYQ